MSEAEDQFPVRYEIFCICFQMFLRQKTGDLQIHNQYHLSSNDIMLVHKCTKGVYLFTYSLFSVQHAFFEDYTGAVMGQA